MSNPNQKSLEGVAYSYVRFSSKRQERGASVSRQTELRDLWLAKHPDVTLDDTLRMSDLGVSGFRGKHRTDDKAALSAFMRGVESGHIRKGSILLLENLDRLTREDEIQATHTLLGLLLAGIRVVTLAPEQTFDRDSAQLEIMRAVMELGRGHGESLRKSHLLTDAWRRKKVAAAETRKAYGASCPAWLDLVGGVGGKYQLKPGARELIRRIHQLAQSGMGARAIAVKLNAEKVEHFVSGSIWNCNYVWKLLARREVLGVFQPHRCDGHRRIKDGEPVADYFPPVVDEATWLLTQQSLRSRVERGGRPSSEPDHVNVFQGLMHDARTGNRLICINHTRGVRVFLPATVNNGKGGPTFPVSTFEDCILGELAELDPHDVFGRGPGDDEVAMLEAHVARLDGQLRMLADSVDDEDPIPEFRAKASKKATERKDTIEALDRAKAKKASPLSEALGNCRGLVAALHRAKGEAARDLRIRIRHALARLIEGVYCVFTGPKTIRIAAVQVWFAGGQSSRSYLLTKTQSLGPSRRPEAVTVESWVTAGLPDSFDLRKPEQSGRLEKALARVLRDRGINIAKLAQ